MEPQRTFQASDATKETHHATIVRRAMSELLEDAGNCRQSIQQVLNLRPLSDSLFSEQQKLRVVLDWAHSFLSSSSDVHDEICRADSLKLEMQQRETEKTPPTYKYSSTAINNHPVSCAASGNEVLQKRGTTEEFWQVELSNYKKSEQNNCLSRHQPPTQEDLHILFTSETDDETWPENRETEDMELQHTTSRQTPSHHNCRTSKVHKSNHRLHTSLSDGSSNQTFTLAAATRLIKETRSCWSNASKNNTGAVSTTKILPKNNDAADIIYERAQLEVELSGNQKELKKEAEQIKNEKAKIDDGRMEETDDKMCKESTSAYVVYTNDNLSHSEQEKLSKQVAKTANPTFNNHLKIPSNLTIYEQYQLCVDQLYHLRLRKGAEKEMKTEEKAPPAAEAQALLTSSSTNAEIKKRPDEAQSQTLSAAETTQGRASGTINENKNRTTHKIKTTLTKPGENKHRDDLNVNAAVSAESRSLCQKNYITSTAHLDLNGNNYGFMKRTAEALTSADKDINTHNEHLRAAPADVEESAALTANPGLKSHRVGVKGQKKRTGGGGQWGLCEKSHRTNGASLPRQQMNRRRSADANKRTRKLNAQTHTETHTLEARLKHTTTPAYRNTHTCPQPTKTHAPHDDPRPTSVSTADDNMNNTYCEYNPAGVRVRDWLFLPDEVWLSILSLLPLSDLCTAVQVCSRLHTVATDHTLWKKLRIQNSTLTEQWLWSVGKRRPRSLCLHSCSSRSVTSCGLEMFFTLCRNTLEEVSVTGCIGPGLHGDQMLPLIGRLCDHVASVDVSWSGATDRGVKALSDGDAGLRLKSVVLNGCHVTDDPLKKLVMRHKQSLCRLEVFGCQFLTAACLQTVYQMCPGLQHLNIGQVPKVNALSLTVMTSHLKSLISLNLTGLKAVTDATLDTLLQNCVELQSLTLSSCPGVTDLTLHNISKYTPCIRSLDVSLCKAITDFGVKFLTLGCKRLQQLDLSSTATGNRGVTLLANYCSGHLHTVKLSFCHITLENILELCRRCKRLKLLHLYGCARLPTEREIREVNATVKVYPLP